MNAFAKQRGSETPMNVVRRGSDPGGPSIEERALKSIRICLTENLYLMIISAVADSFVRWKEPQFRGKSANLTTDGGAGPYHRKSLSNGSHHCSEGVRDQCMGEVMIDVEEATLGGSCHTAKNTGLSIGTAPRPKIVHVNVKIVRRMGWFDGGVSMVELLQPGENGRLARIQRTERGQCSRYDLVSEIFSRTVKTLILMKHCVLPHFMKEGSERRTHPTCETHGCGRRQY